MRLTKMVLIGTAVVALGFSVAATAGKGAGGGGGSGGAGGMSGMDGMAGADPSRSMSMEQHRNRVQTGAAEQQGELVRERNENEMSEAARGAGGGQKGK